MKRTRVITIILIALVLLPGGLYAWNRTHATRMQTLERRLEPADLAKESELVVVGIPVKAKPRLVKNDTAGTLVYTDWTIDVRETLKGAPPSTLVVTVPGGERFGQKTIADQFDGLKKNAEYLMYLTYIPETKWWTPLSTTQAVFERQGAAFTDAADRQQTTDEARAAIRQAEAR